MNLWHNLGKKQVQQLHYLTGKRRNKCHSYRFQKCPISVRCNKAFSKLITKVMFIWPFYWYSRSHDCRILYVIGTPDHMIVGYYMLFWIFTGDTDSYSLSVFYIPWAIRRGRYNKQTGNVNLYPQWSPNNNYILLKWSDQSNTRKTTHKLWLFSGWQILIISPFYKQKN